MNQNEYIIRELRILNLIHILLNSSQYGMKQYRNGALITCKAKDNDNSNIYIKTKYCSFLGGLRIRDEILIKYVLYIGFRFSVYYQL